MISVKNDLRVEYEQIQDQDYGYKYNRYHNSPVRSHL